ncbi:Myopalladin [Merluccius polli]|uniref:Myopalladin n=1 Tax=Merluccius polli TaxID=89951 RepID=A0AA47P441_MERPO|nr:Myopalladin [Merluccius polli]
MQEHNVGQPPQLLRESYLAEARAQQRHSDMSRSDSSNSHRLVYGSLKGKAEDPVCHDDRQGPDLSAFLSQEELDKSVNLACQAIGQESREEKAVKVVEKAPGGAALAAPSATSSFDVPPSAPPSFSIPPSTPSSSCAVLPAAAPSVLAFPSPSSTVSAPQPAPQPAPVRKEPAQPVHMAFRADTKLERAPAQPANGMSHSKAPGETPSNDPDRSARGPPYGLENQSKKEFLNKAADFIEELSSLFKANSSKRVRPRSCKTHKSRTQNKSQSDDGLTYALGPNDRERPVLAPQPEDEDVESGPSPAAISYQPEPGPERGAERPLLPQPECLAAEEQQQQCGPSSQQVEEEEAEAAAAEEEEEEAGRLASTDTPYSEDPICEPPCFIQKLKSREVLEGSKVQLDCIVRGLPVPEVRWFCEGKELENSPDIQILTDVERHSLIIAEAFEEDTGRYSCFASNFYGTDSTSAEIYVEGASSTDSDGEQLFEHKTPTNPVAAQPAASIGADDSDSSSQNTIISTTAITAGEPQQHPATGPLREEEAPAPFASIQQAAPPAPEFSTTTAPQFLHQEPTEVAIVQSCATFPPPEDTGPPEAQEEPVFDPLPVPVPIASFQPLVQAVTDVPVNEFSAEHPNSNHLSHQEQDVRPIMAAPVFTKSLQEVLALESQLVVLECRVKGVPSPRVEWYREGTVIEDSPDFRILQKKPRSPSESEEICTLVIAEVFPEDSGMFTCTASNKYGTVSSIGALRVKGNGRGSSNANTLSSAVVESGQVQESFLSEVTAPAVKHQPEVTMTTSVMPHSSSIRLDSLSSSSLRLDPLSSSSIRLDPLSSSSIRLDPLSTSTIRMDPLSSSSIRLDPLTSSSLRLDPLSSSTLRLDPLSSSTLRLDPHSSSILRPDLLSASLPSLDPQALGSSSCERFSYTSTPRLGPQYLNIQQLDQSGSSEIAPKPHSVDNGTPFYLKPFSGSSAVAAEPQATSLKAEQETPKNRPTLPDLVTCETPKVRVTPTVVPLPDPPANSCLKTSTLTNHREPRSSAKAGLRVHFRLPEDEEEEQCDTSGWPYEDASLTANKGPPPVLTKPKLDPAQLQLLHNQVLLEQQQDGDSHSHSKARTESPAWTQALPQSQSQYQPAPQAQSLTQSQPTPRTQSLTQSQPTPHTQSLTQSQPTPHTQSLTQSQPTPHTQSLTESQLTPHTQSLTQSQPAPRSQSQYQPAPYTQSLTQSQPAPHSQSLIQSQPAPRSQSQYQPPPYTQSLTQSQQAPQSQSQYQPPPQTQALAQSQSQISPLESVVWSPRLHREPIQQHFQLYPNTAVTTQSHTTVSSFTMAPTMPSLTSSPAPILHTTPAPATNRPAPPQLKMAPSVRPLPSAPQLNATPTSVYSSPSAAVTPMNTIHASHLNLSLAALSKSMPPSQFSSLPTTSQSTLSSLQEITSPTPMLRSTHASLMNLAATSQSFNYARPKEFIAAQPLSPVMSPSPTESPVPLLNELAAELNSSAASSPTIPPFSPPPRVFPTRVLQSPTSPLSMMSSPTLISAPFLNSVFAGRAQSPPQASSSASSSSTPSPIQNPVAFLSSVLPSLHLAQATNAMGLPKGAPAGQVKRLPKSRIPSSEDIRVSKEVILNDIERRLRFNDDSSHFGFQQEYKVSNFEQRLMSEIEFRLERTPVEESDDEVHHDEVPTGRCIAPIFDKKLKNFRAMEGVSVTFSCKLVGIPVPKVYWFKDGKQILRKNDHYKKIREGDGTCALHIDYTTNDDDGNYTVMAANPQGRISCSGHLIVQTGASRNRTTPIHSQRVRARIQEVEEGEQTQERFFQPHFLQAPGDMVAHEGRLCRLDCKVSGLPNPELMWLVNGKPIYPDIFHRMLVRENGVHSLVIDPVVQNHAGVYTCIASNKAGQSSFCLDLKVLEKEVKQPPHFVEKLQNTGIPEGNPARLECRVLGMPPPAIFWKKDNDTIPRTKDRFSMHQDATGYVCLLIQPTRKEDAGWYTVSAKNEAGIVSCTSRLDIYAQWHQSIPTPMKKAPRTGSRYAALTGQGLDIKSVFPSSESGPILFASSPLESKLESEEL